MTTIIRCDCEHNGPDRMQCGATTAMGTPKPCSCDCHAATNVAVSLNRAEVEAALKAAGVGGLLRLQVVPVLCRRWGIDR